MKELPILFSTEMVQALLTGKKTMTRRKCQKFFNQEPDYFKYVGIDNNGNHRFELLKGISTGNLIRHPKVYQQGDLLWVKETWCEPILFDGAEDDYFYKASHGIHNCKHISGKWEPSLFMPKKAARIWLKVTSIKVERLQSISAEDSIKEGIKEIWGLGYKHYTASKHFSKKELEEGCPFLTSQILSFLTLWESINGKESLELNPWVFAYEFKVVSTTGKDAICM